MNQRRRMLTWLRRADFESYAYVISKLGLQDIYTSVVGVHVCMCMCCGWWRRAGVAGGGGRRRQQRW